MPRFSQVLAIVFASGLALAGAQPAAASVLLLENLTNIQSGIVFDETRGPESGILTRIEIGDSDVSIDGFGVFGRQTAAGNVKFAIFNRNGASFDRVYVSGSIAAAAAPAVQWYDAPTFALTLLADNVYYFGLISDQSFTYRFGLSVGAVSANGLTSTQSNVTGANGNFANFADPTITDTCCIAQMSLRITAPGETTEPNVPEPAALALLGLGLAGLGLVRRRRNR